MGEFVKTRSSAEMKESGDRQILNQLILNVEEIKDKGNENEFAS